MQMIKKTNSEQNSNVSFDDLSRETQDQIINSIITALIHNIREKKIIMKLASINKDPKIIENLQVREVMQLLCLPETRKELVNLNLNLDQLVNCIEKSRLLESKKRDEAENIRWMLDSGATKTLILNTFPNMEKTELDLWIKMTARENDYFEKIGRTKTITNQKIVNSLLQEWHNLRKTAMSDIERYRKIKEIFPNYSLAALITTINQNDI